MVIRNKLDQNDFINASLAVLYSKLLVKILTYLSIFVFIMFILAIIDTPDPSYTSLFIPTCMLLALPINVYFSSKSNYNNNTINRETLEYYINPEFFSVKGESFETKIQWGAIHKITKKWGWILIWHNSQIANPIPKEKIYQQQFLELTNIIEINNIKSNI